MKKIFLSIFIILAFVVYSIFHNNTKTTALPAASTPNANGGTSSTRSISIYKDGTYIGSVADAVYGNLQVQAIIAGGKITNVQFLQAPSDRRTSVVINQQADPTLAQETIQAQSAQVDIVSGATDSSQAFMQSLQSALDQAKA
ncbi:MAG TPA: FMN-binding protein [Candidatus Sulfotelmatobacter sp.]|jgi:uncharacterized protein with FMN-binding domain|nr:FMN-binding protein [Candidatus Sulfotelmatobacter sp.]